MIDTKNWFQLRPMYSYIRKQAENEKFLKYLEIGGTFTLIAIFLFFTIMPTVTTISSLIGDIKSKEAFIKKADLKIANVLKGQENYSQVQEKYDLIEDSFPSLAQYYKGVSNIATLFRDSSLTINQIDLSLDKDKEITNRQFFKSYQINVVGEGQYTSIMETIKKMINNRRLVNATDIRLSQLESDNIKQSGSKTIKINLSSDLYFLPDNNEKK
jgi:Tfp pilus assembly protein PilO